ncbi:hypothetical protein JOM56_007679 [Amanita muscaria]
MSTSKKRKLDDDPKSVNTRRVSSWGFRVAQPAKSNTTVHSTPSLVTTLRKGVCGRRGYRRELLQTHSSTPPTEKVEQPRPDEAIPDPPLLDLEHLNDIDTSVSPRKPQPKRARKNTTTTKVLEWLVFRQSILDELLRHDGHGDFFGHDGSLLRCSGCMVTAHRDHPLHRIEYWNGKFFDKVTLKSLGLRIQLGHGGAPCSCPPPGPRDFCVFDTSGIHHVSVDFCDCRTNGIVHTRTQLMRARWFPATLNWPKTVFTFDCLDTFHKLMLQGKTSLYDFYHTVLHKTDNMELEKPVYRYTEFQHSFRIWRNLLMLKRAGRGQDPAGAKATARGELAVECPACPHPGRNLPEGWESAGALLYLYTLYLAVDANFKLKGKDRGITDAELAPGWASFVEELSYQEHLKNYVDQPEINTCQSEHDAIVRAAVRCTPGYRVTGTGLCLCPRHGLVRKNGVGDLQKGEKYCNMDYIVLSALSGTTLPRVVISYDIGCQWSKNLRRRMEEYPDEMKLDPNMQIDIGIPGWHINGHGEKCKSNFCLSFMPGVGRTCGEDVETAWAQTNSLGTSVREMGPGARHETLNDQWCGMNFRKIVGFRTLFLNRLKTAFVMRDKHRAIFEKFSSTFPLQTVKKWEEKILQWNLDNSKPNPYAEPASSTTLHDVRLELAKEDAAIAAGGVISPHKTTLTTFLMIGLDLEEHQCVLVLSFHLDNTKAAFSIQDNRHFR